MTLIANINEVKWAVTSFKFMGQKLNSEIYVDEDTILKIKLLIIIIIILIACISWIIIIIKSILEKYFDA